jgi:hypothetical protein
MNDAYGHAMQVLECKLNTRVLHQEWTFCPKTSTPGDNMIVHLLL